MLGELEARVDAIGIAPTGLNINDGVGSTHPQGLAARVRDTGAELGIAFDGDGDRVLFVAVSYTHLDVYKRQVVGSALVAAMAACTQTADAAANAAAFLQPLRDALNGLAVSA